MELETKQTAAALLTSGQSLLLEAQVGSKAYGLQNAQSDTDKLAVFAATTDKVLSLAGLSNLDKTIVQTNPDITCHEIGKFLQLALTANPTITELLWVESYLNSAPLGLQLVELRSSLLSTKAVIDSYIGYTYAQIKRINQMVISDHARNRKHARHTFRLLIQAEQLLLTGKLTLHLGEKVELVGQMADLSVNNFAKFASVVEEKIIDLKNHKSQLPDKPDTDRVEKYLLTLRRSML